MALDPNHWSSKLQAAFKSAVELAIEQRHAEARVLHLGLALLEDAEGLARQVRSKAPCIKPRIVICIITG